MSFSVSLASDQILVDAGSTTPLAFEISNLGEESDYFEISIEGVDNEWFTIPEASISVAPGTSITDKIFIRPLRSPENAAGSYPFVLKVRSLNSGETKTTKGVIGINAFHQVSLDCEPKRVTLRGLNKEVRFSLKVLNLSNVEHTLQVYGSDPDNQVSFEFEPDKFDVGPGQEREFECVCKLKTHSLLSGSKLFGLSFSARSANYPTVAAYSHGQLEKQPLISPISLASLMIMFLLLLLWVQALPKAPAIEVFELSPNKVKAGEEITVIWRVKGAEKVLLTAEDGQTRTAITESGEWKFTTSKADPDFTIKLEAIKGGKRSFTERFITVDAPVQALLPKIRSFTITPDKVSPGQEVRISYKLNESVTSAEILPGGFKLDVKDDSFSFVPNWEGDMEVKLVATDASGNRDDKTVTVSVIKKSVAKIISLRASPEQVKKSEGILTVSWLLENTVKAELMVDGNTFEISPTSGAQTFQIQKSGIVKLVATDADGKKTTRVIPVKVVDDLPQEPTSQTPGEDPDPALNDPASTGGGTTSGGTPPSGGSNSGNSGNTGTPPNR